MKNAIIFLNGELDIKDKDVIQTAEDCDIYCADGGARHTFSMGLTPKLILGDLDSIPPDVLKYYEDKGIKLERYPVKKDKTDFELLLEKVMESHYREIIIYGGLGGRFDHTIANVLVLEKLYKRGKKIVIKNGNEKIMVVSGETTIQNEIGRTISFIPISRIVKGVTLKGFEYEVEDSDFYRGSTIGISNIVTKERALVKIETGKMIMVIN